MPSFKLTKLYVQHLLDEKWVNLFSDGKDDKRYSQLLKLLQAENAKEQIEQLKKVSKDLSKLISDGSCVGNQNSGDQNGTGVDDTDTGGQVLYSLKFLVHLFFISTVKNPSRRVLVSTFQGFPEDVQNRILCPAIERSLHDLYQKPITGQNNQPFRFEDCSEWRHHVDTISALLENFNLGERCVTRVCIETLDYLSQLQQLFYGCYGPHLSPVQQNEVMHHCLETVKLANRVCQRSSVAMETKLKDSMVFKWFLTTCSSFLEIDIQILQKADFLIDCRTTSAMNICLLVRYGSTERNVIHMLLDNVFIDSFLPLLASQDLEEPDWFKQVSFDRLSKFKLTSSSFLCLCYGILSMVSMEMLMMPYSGKCLLLDVLLQEFLDLSKRCADVGSKLLGAKSIAFLTQRVRNHLEKLSVDSVHPDISSRLQGGGADVSLMLEFVWTSWEDTVEAVRFTVKDIFENVVTVHLLTTQSDSSKNDAFLQKLTVSILDDVSWSCKGKYGTLSVLIRHLGSARMLELHDGIARDVLQQLQEQTLSCYASDLYECLFRNHLSQQEPEKDCGNSWFHTWVNPVIAVLCGPGSLQRKHVLEYVLPKLLKTGEATLHYIISTLTSQLFYKQEDTGSEGHSRQSKGSETGSQLGALIMCLRRARAMGQLQGESNRSVRASGRAKRGGNSAKPVSSYHKNSNSDCSVLRSPETRKPVEGSEMWCGVVDVGLLRQALICRDEQIRLDAFALLCENQKTTETIGVLELEMIRGFIPQNLNNQNPAYRQHFLSHLKKFLTRLKESSHSLLQKLKRDQSFLTHLKQYRLFLCWLTRCLFNGLYAGSTFARRSTCLEGLSLIMNIFSTGVSDGESFVFYNEVRPYDIHTLLQCLTDTFEDNKLEASKILIGCSVAKQEHGMLEESQTGQLLEVALTLSCSTRPQDSTTAAYMFGVLLHEPNILHILQEHVSRLTGAGNQTFKNDNEIEDESEAKNENEAKISQDDNEVEVQLQQTLLDGKTQSSETDVCISVLETLGIDDLNTMNDGDIGKRFLLLWILVKNLEEQTRVAQNNLIVAAASEPLYPTMQCMRYSLSEIDFRKIPVNSVPAWQNLLHRVIHLCLEISEVVSPVVHNCSPEGNVPAEAMPGDGLAAAETGVDEQVARSHETVMLMPEYLVVCCWRSIKEISLILGQITSDVPIAISNSYTATSDVPIVTSNSQTATSDIPIVTSNTLKSANDARIASNNYVTPSDDHSVVISGDRKPPVSDDVSDLASGVQATTIAEKHDIGLVQGDVPTNLCTYGLLDEQQILDIGDYFTHQLLESKHRGAFELAYAGFVKVTDMLWRSSLSELHRLPSQWLDQVMTDIQAGDQSSRLCATRRSAGVPFYIQALVSTEPVSTGRKCFRRTMDELLALAYNSSDSDEDFCDSKVHALNVLRALFKDSRMKDDVTPYIADGLKVAILGFKSPLWAVRNSATLLMSAMMVRIFGVKRSKDETSFSRKNCQTGRTFFYNYPSLYQFLLDELSETTQDVSRRLHPGLYPILMVLGRLFPSAMEGTDTSLNLAAFIPFIIKCSHSPVLKTRVMAARALQPLVEKSHVTSVFTDLLTLLPVQSGEDVKQNHVHGVLLQLRQMLGTVPLLSSGNQTDLAAVVLPMWTDRMGWLISRANPCLLTRKEALEVSAEIIHRLEQHSAIYSTLVAVLRDEMHREQIKGANRTEENSDWKPALWEYQSTVCHLYLSMVTSDTIEVTSCQGNDEDQDQDSDSDVKYLADENRDDADASAVVCEHKHAAVSDKWQEIEIAVLTFLRSSSYDVRRTVLSMLCDVSAGQVVVEKLTKATGNNNSGKGGVAMETTHINGVYQCLCKSQKVYSCLITMLDSEVNEQCQVLILRLLQLSPFQYKQVLFEQMTFSVLRPVIDRFIAEIQTDSLSDCLTAAIIEYFGVYIQALYSSPSLAGQSETQNNGKLLKADQSHDRRQTIPLSENQSSISITDRTANIQQCLDVIVQCCSTSEANADVHLACAKAIKMNWLQLFTGCHSNQVVVYEAVLDLLQVDDLEVKAAAADIQDLVSSNKFKVPVHAYASMDLLVDGWLHSCEPGRAPDVSGWVLDRIVENREPAEVEEERLFDRGEMNTYWDEIDYIQVLDGVLMCYIQEQITGDCQGFTWKKLHDRWSSRDALMESVAEGVQTMKSSNTGLDASRVTQLVSAFLQETTDLDILVTGLELKQMFLNSTLYEKSVRTLFKMVTVLKYGLLLSKDKHCRNICIQKLNDIRRKCVTAVLPPVVGGGVDTVCRIADQVK